jgi:hypothetical protein
MANFIWIFKQRPCVRRQKHVCLSWCVAMHIKTTCAPAVYVIHFTAWRNLTWRCNDIRIYKWALCLMVCPRLQAGGSWRGNCVTCSAVFLLCVCMCVIYLQLLAVGVTWFSKRHPTVFVSLVVFKVASGTLLRCQCARYGLKAWRNLTWCTDIRIYKCALCLMVCPRLQADGSRRGNCVACCAVFLSCVCMCVIYLRLLAVGVT